MKKLLGLVVLGLLIYQPTLRADPFEVLIWEGGNDITNSEDPTTFQKLIVILLFNFPLEIYFCNC